MNTKDKRKDFSRKHPFRKNPYIPQEERVLMAVKGYVNVLKKLDYKILMPQKRAELHRTVYKTNALLQNFLEN